MGIPNKSVNEDKVIIDGCIASSKNCMVLVKGRKRDESTGHRPVKRIGGIQKFKLPMKQNWFGSLQTGK